MIDRDEKEKKKRERNIVSVIRTFPQSGRHHCSVESCMFAYIRIVHLFSRTAAYKRKRSSEYNSNGQWIKIRNTTGYGSTYAVSPGEIVRQSFQPWIQQHNTSAKSNLLRCLWTRALVTCWDRRRGMNKKMGRYRISCGEYPAGGIELLALATKVDFPS